jgi:hypothetical protein
MTGFTMVQGESKLLVYGVVDLAGAAVVVTGATVVWELSQTVGGEAFLTKTLDDYVTIAGSNVEVEVIQADTLTLAGVYSYELTITDTLGNESKSQGTILVNPEIQAEPVTP